MPRKKKHEENEEQRCKRQNANRLSRQRRRQMQTDDQREKRRQIERDRQRIYRQRQTEKRRRVERQRQYVCRQQGQKTTMNVAKAVDVSMYHVLCCEFPCGILKLSEDCYNQTGIWILCQQYRIPGNTVSN